MNNVILNRHIRTSDGDFDGKLCVAEDGEHGGEPGHHVGQHHRRPGHLPCLDSGENEYSGADHRPDPEPHQIPPVQRFLHLVAATRPHLPHLRALVGPRQDAILQPPRRLHQRPPVAPPAPKRFLREEVVLLKRATPPPPHHTSLSSFFTRSHGRSLSLNEISNTSYNL